MCHVMVCPDCRTFVQRPIKNQNIVPLPWPAKSNDLAPIEHVLDIYGCNVRYNHDVRPRLQMITALHLEWAAVPQNDIRTIIGSMCHRGMPVCEPTEAISLSKTICDIPK